MTIIPFDFADPPPLDANHPCDNTTVEGENLTLQCRVTAANPEPNITWYSVTANNTALSYGFNLTFINISRSDAGKYYCLADNGIERAVKSRIATTEVLCKFYVIENASCVFKKL